MEEIPEKRRAPEEERQEEEYEAKRQRVEDDLDIDLSYLEKLVTLRVIAIPGADSSKNKLDQMKLELMFLEFTMGDLLSLASVSSVLQNFINQLLSPQFWVAVMGSDFLETQISRYQREDPITKLITHLQTSYQPDQADRYRKRFSGGLAFTNFVREMYESTRTTQMGTIRSRTLKRCQEPPMRVYILPMLNSVTMKVNAKEDAKRRAALLLDSYESVGWGKKGGRTIPARSLYSAPLVRSKLHHDPIKLFNSPRTDAENFQLVTRILVIATKRRDIGSVKENDNLSHRAISKRDLILLFDDGDHTHTFQNVSKRRVTADRVSSVQRLDTYLPPEGYTDNCTFTISDTTDDRYKEVYVSDGVETIIKPKRAAIRTVSLIDVELDNLPLMSTADSLWIEPSRRREIYMELMKPQRQDQLRAITGGAPVQPRVLTGDQVAVFEVGARLGKLLDPSQEHILVNTGNDKYAVWDTQKNLPCCLHVFPREYLIQWLEASEQPLTDRYCPRCCR